MTKNYQSPRARFIAMSTEDALLVLSAVNVQSDKGGHEGYGDAITVTDDEPASKQSFQTQCWGK